MKKVYFKFKDKELFLDYITTDDFLSEINENEEILKIKDLGDKVEVHYKEVVALYPIAIYLLGNEMEDLANRIKDDEVLSKIYETLTVNNYFTSLISLEVDRFFMSRDLLIEDVFINFNLKGLKEEIKLIEEDANMNLEAEKIKDNLYDNYKKNGLDVKSYSELTVKYIDGELNLENLKGDCINGANLAEQLGLELNIDKNDKWVFDLSLCSIVCTVLKVEKLIVPREYKELYNDLLENESLLDTNIVLVLK